MWTHAIVYYGMYIVFEGDKKTIIRLEGVPETTDWANGTGLNKTFFTMAAVSSHPSLTSSNEIVQLASMDFYGLFINVDGKTDFIEIEPQKVIERESNGTLKYIDAASKLHKYSSTETLKYDNTALLDTAKTLGIRVRDGKGTSSATDIKFA